MPIDDSVGRFLDAMRAVRAYLPDLLPDEHDVARYDRDIGELLRMSAVEPSDSVDRLHRLVRGTPKIDDWLRLVLADPGLRPPDVQDWEERGVTGIGAALPVPARKYVCPVDGDFVRYQRVAGQDMGDCPGHGVALVPA